MFFILLSDPILDLSLVSMQYYLDSGFDHFENLIVIGESRFHLPFPPKMPVTKI